MKNPNLKSVFLRSGKFLRYRGKSKKNKEKPIIIIIGDNNGGPMGNLGFWGGGREGGGINKNLGNKYEI